MEKKILENIKKFQNIMKMIGEISHNTLVYIHKKFIHLPLKKKKRNIITPDVISYYY